MSLREVIAYLQYMRDEKARQAQEQQRMDALYEATAGR